MKMCGPVDRFVGVLSNWACHDEPVAAAPMKLPSALRKIEAVPDQGIPVVCTVRMTGELAVAFVGVTARVVEVG